MNNGRVAMLVAAAYERCRRKGPSGQFYTFPASQRKFAVKAAQVVEQHHADPYEYVEAQFLFWPVEGGFPWPSQLATPAALQRWMRYREECNPDWLKLHAAQLVTVRAYAALYPERTLSDIILDARISLRAYFRVLSCKEAIHEYLAEAQREIVESLGLRQFLERSGVDVATVFRV